METPGKLQVEELKVGAVMETLFWVNPAEGSRYRFRATHLKGMLTRQEVVHYYLQATGRTASNFAFYEVYGLFRLAAIAQQIYYRFAKGLTADPRFAALLQGVRILCEQASRAIERGGI